MDHIYNLINSNIEIIIIVSLLLWLILTIILILNTVVTKKLKRKYDNFIGEKNTSGDSVSIEALLTEYLAEAREIGAVHKDIKESIGSIERRLSGCVQKIGVVRYNPFENMGGNLSFAVALLDENNSGIVLNGIHNRNSSHTYAKPIEKGESPFTLSEEEKESIDIAIKKVIK